MKNNSSALDSQLDALHLPFCKEHCHPSAAKAAKGKAESKKDEDDDLA